MAKRPLDEDRACCCCIELVAFSSTLLLLLLRKKDRTAAVEHGGWRVRRSSANPEVKEDFLTSSVLLLPLLDCESSQNCPTTRPLVTITITRCCCGIIIILIHF